MFPEVVQVKPNDDYTVYVYFSDGSQQQVNLGEIIFYYEKGLDEAINYISISS